MCLMCSAASCCCITGCMTRPEGCGGGRAVCRAVTALRVNLVAPDPAVPGGSGPGQPGGRFRGPGLCPGPERRPAAALATSGRFRDAAWPCGSASRACSFPPGTAGRSGRAAIASGLAAARCRLKHARKARLAWHHLKVQKQVESSSGAGHQSAGRAGRRWSRPAGWVQATQPRGGASGWPQLAGPGVRVLPTRSRRVRW